VNQYTTPPTLMPGLEGMIDPDYGFLCMTSHWRPDPEAANPEMPGQKLSMSSYIPAFAHETCLCGSGRPFGNCCRPKRLWHPICPNPGLEGYSLTKPQSATFRNVDGDAIRERLMAAPQLRCTEADPDRVFWVFHGDPVLEDQYGRLCFGDLELKHNRILLVTAMSDLRLQTLLVFLSEVVGQHLGKPQTKQDPILGIDKQTNKMRTITASGRQPPRRRSGRKRRRR